MAPSTPMMSRPVRVLLITRPAVLDYYQPRTAANVAGDADTSLIYLVSKQLTGSELDPKSIHHLITRVAGRVWIIFDFGELQNICEPPVCAFSVKLDRSGLRISSYEHPKVENVVNSTVEISKQRRLALDYYLQLEPSIPIPVSTMPLSDVPTLVGEKYFHMIKYPENDFSNQTIIVTGANTGLGFEAAKHFVRLGAEKVILAVRSVSKGEAALEAIETSTRRKGVATVWELDLGSYQSVKRFAERANGLPRLDAVVENAGIAAMSYSTLEDNESTITVNVVSTFLLALLILPKLRESSRATGLTSRLTIVSSGVHAWPKFEERTADNIFEALNNKKTAKMGERYPVSKLLEVLVVRELAEQSKSWKDSVAINVLNPGFCQSELARNATGFIHVMITLQKLIAAKSTEQGSRTLVSAAASGAESHGKYFHNGVIDDDALSPFVRSTEGKDAQKKVWKEITQKLEGIQPGILQNLK
ncbi:hypothetical protein FQN54_006925 [Arachnomyces sp. PD_36]|nr:hypothetical protein FQN54_006925 [Arachnomyces sp. PD_36]